MKAKPKATRKRTSQKRAKAFTGVHALLLFPSGEDHRATLDLMRRFSAGVRYAYNRLLEGQTREALKRENGPLRIFFGETGGWNTPCSTSGRRTHPGMKQNGASRNTRNTWNAPERNGRNAPPKMRT